MEVAGAEAGALLLAAAALVVCAAAEPRSAADASTTSVTRISAVRRRWGGRGRDAYFILGVFFWLVFFGGARGWKRRETERERPAASLRGRRGRERQRGGEGVLFTLSRARERCGGRARVGSAGAASRGEPARPMRSGAAAAREGGGTRAERRTWKMGDGGFRREKCLFVLFTSQACGSSFRGGSR